MKLKREIEYQNSHIFDSFSGSSGSEREKNVTIFVKKGQSTCTCTVILQTILL